jgi:hypothetical protein
MLICRRKRFLVYCGKGGSGARNLGLGGNAKTLLTGGLPVSDVLFNVTGSNSTFTIGGDALFNGTLLATIPPVHSVPCKSPAITLR